MSSEEIPTTHNANPEIRELATMLADQIREMLVERRNPLIVGIDGRSAAGKSTVASIIAQEFADTHDSADAVTVIEGDQFYAGGSSESWDHKTASQKAAGVIDWRRQREVLAQLLQDGCAEWRPFDWEAENWDTDTVPLSPIPIVTQSAPVIIMEGAYSCRPELHELLDVRVLLSVPPNIRRRQLLDREGYDYRADWEARWSEAENYYFHNVMPPERFDLVLDYAASAS